MGDATAASREGSMLSPWVTTTRASAATPASVPAEAIWCLKSIIWPGLDKPKMLFDSTLRKDLSRSFGATLVVILTIVLTMMLIRTLGQAAVGRVSPQDVILLLGYIALGQLPTML